MAAAVYVVGMLVVSALAIWVMSGKTVQASDMSPASLDSFQITRCEEGSVVTLHFGKRRVTGNILWYGNLQSEEVRSESSGGKGGGGGGDVVTGYKYYLDLWISICRGPCQIEKIYVNDEPATLDRLGQYTFNNGTQDTYPVEPGPFANRLAGVSHIFLKRFFIGENTTHVPTIHFVVTRQSSSPVDHTLLPNGVNPATVIYELLKEGGARTTDIDKPSFNKAAAYWKKRGYGINITWSAQQEVREAIQKIFTYVDGCLSVNDRNAFVLTAFDPDEKEAATIKTQDFLDFHFTRKSWTGTDNDFRAKYTDEEKDFTERVVRCINPANIRLQNHRKQKTVNLTAFRDKATASKRIWEIMKSLSYPHAMIKFETTLKFGMLTQGQVIKIVHEDYGIKSAYFRIITRQMPEHNENKMSFEAIQMTEKLFDFAYQVGGGNQWERPRYEPKPLIVNQVFELPYNSTTGHEPAFLLLAARRGIEDKFSTLVSITGADFTLAGNFTTFSQYGVLDETYSADTLTIDDETGITFTPVRDDPQFTTISRAALFSGSRVAVINNELIAFEKVVPVEQKSFKLTGCVRGVLNTKIQPHRKGSPIWLTRLDNNVLTGVTAKNFYVKFVPHLLGASLDPAQAVAVHVVSENRAMIPWAPARIKAVRTGPDTVVTWWPVNQDHNGAGAKAPGQLTDQEPMLFDGDFQIKTSHHGNPHGKVAPGTTETITATGQYELSVQSRRTGFVSPWSTITVGAQDGTYIGPNVLNPTGLERLTYNQQGWNQVLADNMRRLNDELLKVKGLTDVELTSLADADVLQWDNAKKKFVNVQRSTIWP